MITGLYVKRALQRHWDTERFGSVPPEQLIWKLAGIKQIIFPSIVTFYAHNPVVRQYFAVQDQTLLLKQRVLHLAASLAAAAPVPVFQAVVNAAKEEGHPLREMEVDRISDTGVIGKMDRTWYLFGDMACLQQEQIEMGVAIQTLAQQFEKEGKYILFLAQKQPKRLLALFACEYPLIEAGSELVQALHDRHVEPILLTGTKTVIAQGIARQLGIDLIHSELKAQDKQRMIKTLSNQQESSAVVVDSTTQRSLVTDSFEGLVIRVGEHDRETVAVTTLTEIPALIDEAKRLRDRIQKRLFWVTLE